MQEISASCAAKDLANYLINIEKLSFSDVRRVALTLGSPLKAHDRDWCSDAAQLSITTVIYAANEREWRAVE